MRSSKNRIISQQSNTNEMTNSHQTQTLAGIAIPETWLWNDQVAEISFLADHLTKWTINMKEDPKGYE